MVTPSRPLVSVVIPTFNRPNYLRIALASVLAQTYRELEVVVQDNASPADLSDLVAAFADERITLHRNSHNIGQTPNILAAVRRATGKYVAILGDDDLWRPDFVETLVAPMEANDNVVVSFCDHDIIDSEGRLDTAQTDQVTRRFARHLVRDGMHCPFDEIALVYRSICVVSGALIRRDAINWALVPEDMRISSDIYIAYLLAVTGRSCWYDSRRLMQYRYHATQVSLTDGSRLDQARSGLNFWITFLHDERLNNRPYFKMVCARRAALAMLNRLRCRDWTGAWQDLSTFFTLGLLDPRVVLYHLFYLVRFQIQGIRRFVP